ncbi:hypothetical protein P4H94_14915 [Paenibacillus macerans]|uniref:Holliday junction resolvase RuvC n=1 Tax=Paenibacillus macerans TaxID=44252 RepID=A0A090ZCR0_PAEMA|nr:hypothetical protein [Paenibacillus macerans]KFN08437.1 hypothetical protein DJ90_1611 [Paenibacillus macerans]MCY7557719.1 hypothetical protein [Paenibacillus macerans]MEC0138149.1 hypothetical protein [Paenibacillus macerans]MEC0152404.1 hypothetical protein [Paenibacillus macerans]SUA83633.1 Uncharacterised protein [Paenibacillus macerans]
MPAFGVRCTKDEIYVAILEGSIDSPVITDEARVKIILSSPKTAESRAEALYNLKRDFEQLLLKYKPDVVLVKDQETSRHKIPVQASAQRGEIEGVVLETCFVNKFYVDKVLYAHTKTRLRMEQKSKSFQFEKIDELFGLTLKDDNIKDAILCAWAGL